MSADSVHPQLALTLFPCKSKETNYLVYTTSVNDLARTIANYNYLWIDYEVAGSIEGIVDIMKLPIICPDLLFTYNKENNQIDVQDSYSFERIGVISKINYELTF